MKQYSEACARNRGPILEVLQDALSPVDRVLEVGCGTGQHAVFFAEHLDGVEWLPADLEGRLASAKAWRREADTDHVAEPVALDLFEDAWDLEGIDAIFAANVIHIAPWSASKRLFSHAADLLDAGGLVFLYGPFRYESRPLEPSNERFDRWLKERDPSMGIRGFEEVDAIADAAGFELVKDRAMPANNRSIWWRRAAGRSNG